MADVKIQVSYPANWRGKKHMKENEIYQVSEESVEIYKSKGLNVIFVDENKKTEAVEPEAHEEDQQLVVGTAKVGKRPYKRKEDEL